MWYRTIGVLAHNKLNIVLLYHNVSKAFLVRTVKTFRLHGFQVLLDERGVLKTYNDACEILEDFFKLRWRMYEKRKQYIEDYLQADLLFLSEKARFIEDKIEGKLELGVRFILLF